VLWLLVFGSNGKVQLQALAPRAELVHAQSRRRFCARCAEAVSRDKKEGDESSGFGKGKLYFHSCEPYSTSNKTEYETSYEYLSQFVIPNWGILSITALQITSPSTTS
jgi:hypothetical protein